MESQREAEPLLHTNSPSLHKGGGQRGWVDTYLKGIGLPNKNLKGVRLINNHLVIEAGLPPFRLLVLSSTRQPVMSFLRNLRSPRGPIRYALIMPWSLHRLTVLLWIWRSRATSLTVSIGPIWLLPAISSPICPLINLS